MTTFKVYLPLLTFGTALFVFSQADDNPCGGNRGEKYHPHSSPNHYIQCADDGTSFVRQCNYGSVWSQPLRTCVPGSDVIDHHGYEQGYKYQSQQSYDGYGQAGKPQYSYQQYSIGHGAPKYGQLSASYGAPKYEHEQHYVINLNGNSPGYAYTNYGFAYPSQSYGYAAQAIPSQVNRYPYGYHHGSSIYGYTYQPSYSHQTYTQTPAYTPSYSTAKSYDSGSYSYSSASQGSASHHQPQIAYGYESKHIHHHRPVEAKSAQVYVSRPVATPVRKPDSRCSQQNVRYLADPNDSHKYSECIYGHIHQHTCGNNQFWIHPLRMCLDVKDRRNTAVPLMNPCAGTDDLYKPYPSDPSKYIECRAWYSVLVWSCRENQIWVQGKQSCLDVGQLQPVIPPKVPKYQPTLVRPQPRPQPRPRPRPTQPTYQHEQTVTYTRKAVHAGSNPCDNTTFYFAIIGKPHHFIQCDDFGNAFVRPCATGSTWDDNIQTCVKQLGVQPNTAAAILVDEQTTVTEGEFDFDSAVPLQPDYSQTNTAEHYIQTTHSNGQCNQGNFWIPSHNLCVATSNALLDTDFCHPGDYYFEKHHICASIKISGIEEKSSGASGTYGFSYTDYGSYNTNAGYAQSGNRGSGDKTPDNHCAAKYKTYNGGNPCGSSSTFYYPFPEDENCFIQCDQQGNMYVMSCPSVSAWNQDALQCINFNTYQVNDLDAGAGASYDNTYITQNVDMRHSGKSAGDYQASYVQSQDQSNYISLYDAHNIHHTHYGGGQNYQQQSGGSPCNAGRDSYYVAYPQNNHQFVMCNNLVPYVIWCPHHKYWKQDAQQCFWPNHNQ